MSIILRDKFDFEIGYLVKSPCKTCESRETCFPDCVSDCQILDTVQKRLARGISCTKSFSAAEDYGVCIGGWENS